MKHAAHGCPTALSLRLGGRSFESSSLPPLFQGGDMEDDQENEHPVRNLVLSVCDLKQHGDIPTARCAAQTAYALAKPGPSVTMNTRMYLHGGCDDKKAYGNLHLLEIEQMKWTELQCEGAMGSFLQVSRLQASSRSEVELLWSISIFVELCLVMASRCSLE
eukprot:s1201_g4.t1